MKITDAEVEHIAGLARLKLNEEEIKKYTKNLGEIAEFVEKLNEVNVEGISPTAHILNIKNVFREDELKPSYNREELFKNAPSWDAGCISVPKVVE